MSDGTEDSMMQEDEGESIETATNHDGCSDKALGDLLLKHENIESKIIDCLNDKDESRPISPLNKSLVGEKISSAGEAALSWNTKAAAVGSPINCSRNSETKQSKEAKREKDTCVMSPRSLGNVTERVQEGTGAAKISSRCTRQKFLFKQNSLKDEKTKDIAPDHFKTIGKKKEKTWHGEMGNTSISLKGDTGELQKMETGNLGEHRSGNLQKAFEKEQSAHQGRMNKHATDNKDDKTRKGMKNADKPATNMLPNVGNGCSNVQTTKSVAAPGATHNDQIDTPSKSSSSLSNKNGYLSINETESVVSTKKPIGVHRDGTFSINSKENTEDSRLDGMHLKLALGSSIISCNCLSTHSSLGALAYPVSGTTVIMDIVNCRHVGYLSPCQQRISCVQFSPDGSMLLLGEMGYRPALYVWSFFKSRPSCGTVQSSEVFDTSSCYLLANLQGHEYGIKCAAFSESMKYIVSVGMIHDGVINIWSWPGKELVARGRFSEDILAMSFSKTGPYFVTSGTHHLKFWYPNVHKFTPHPAEMRSLYGRSAILKSFKTELFVDVSCGSKTSAHFVYAITASGIICKLSHKRWVILYKKLQGMRLCSLQVDDDRLIVSCSSWQVIFFNAVTLKFETSIALPIETYRVEHFLSSECLNASMSMNQNNIFLALDNDHGVLTAAGDNGVLCIWDISDTKKIRKKHYWVGHSRTISCMDSTILDCNRNLTSVFTSSNASIRRSDIIVSRAVCCQSQRVIHADRSHQNIRSQSVNESLNVDKLRNASGVRSEFQLSRNKSTHITAVKACSELNYLISGNSHGALTINKLDSFEEVAVSQRHTQAITVIASLVDFTKETKLLASGSRDRCICIFSLDTSFRLLNKLNLHSSSIGGLCLSTTPSGLTLFSSAFDRTFGVCRSTGTKVPNFKVQHCHLTISSVIELKVCDKAQCVVMGTHNGSINIIDFTTLENIQSFRASTDHNARLEKLCVDPCGSFLVTACSNRTINLFNLLTGALLISVKGHASRVSGLEITANQKCLLSATRDGCVFVWNITSRIRPTRYKRTPLRKSDKKLK